MTKTKSKMLITAMANSWYKDFLTWSAYVLP